MPTKITLWLEKDKPTQVKVAKTNEFYIEDMTYVFADLTKQRTESGDTQKSKTKGGDGDVAKQGTDKANDDKQ